MPRWKVEIYVQVGKTDGWVFSCGAQEELVFLVGTPGIAGPKQSEITNLLNQVMYLLLHPEKQGGHCRADLWNRPSSQPRAALSLTPICAFLWRPRRSLSASRPGFPRDSGLSTKSCLVRAGLRGSLVLTTQDVRTRPPALSSAHSRRAGATRVCC